MSAQACQAVSDKLSLQAQQGRGPVKASWWLSTEACRLQHPEKQRGSVGRMNRAPELPARSGAAAPGDVDSWSELSGGWVGFRIPPPRMADQHPELPIPAWWATHPVVNPRTVICLEIMTAFLGPQPCFSGPPLYHHRVTASRFRMLRLRSLARRVGRQTVPRGLSS
ncbi:hypothetical protein BDP55DRAFT_630580 [Colletotrichum godetiae]|uniref:Uncharacterized protein n=1 Tax=Colletotrichum godetiae TaxID=1209918 RepID=A0AAJ0EUA1_9PEZI|nr:uncharacterized protein BDP55DRAFT_630580 [Colletotrichum godetiae]KAK1687384.1 hypothetical protein BDP55DRAFT_630580 [Colletotrichum godetiae]